jgi:hypothetical protein
VAGRELNVDMGDDDLIPAWQTVLELSNAQIAGRLTLVGGLMVAAHARRAQVVMRRPTDDVDTLVDYVADRSSLSDMRATLARLGFNLTTDERHAYRFLHTDGRKVDLMVADHMPSGMRPRLGQRDAFVAPSGEQAIRRRDRYGLHFANGAEAKIGVPDELGALVAKGAAYMVDQRDRGRHVDDAAVLLACIADASDLDWSSVSQNDRRRLTALTQVLENEGHIAWSNLDRDALDQARFNRTLIARIVAR